MKLYIVYFRTMEDSPSVQIVCATYDKALAESKYAEAKAWEDAWMDGLDGDSSDWAEARIDEFDATEDRKPGEVIHVVVSTIWDESVDTEVFPVLYRDNADVMVDSIREFALFDYPGLVPFDEDESIDEAMHLHDESIAVDVYLSVEDVAIESAEESDAVL